MGSRKTHAKPSRKDKKIAKLEAMIAQMRGRVLKKTGRIAECGARVSKFRENNSRTNSQNLLFVIPPLSDAKRNCRSIHIVTTRKKKLAEFTFGLVF